MTAARCLVETLSVHDMVAAMVAATPVGLLGGVSALFCGSTVGLGVLGAVELLRGVDLGLVLVDGSPNTGLNEVAMLLGGAVTVASCGL